MREWVTPTMPEAGQTVYLIRTDPAVTTCQFCGGQHEFWCRDHLPIVLSDPAEFQPSRDFGGYVPVKYQPGRQVPWATVLADARQS